MKACLAQALLKPAGCRFGREGKGCAAWHNGAVARKNEHRAPAPAGAGAECCIRQNGSKL